MKVQNRRRYRWLSWLMLSLSLSPSAARAARQNDYPIVLVHGFAGWGESELLGFKYWGGFVNLRESMTNDGYTTYTATVGPFSSNWDRACELYAYIKGGQVDYGEAHSKAAGHARLGKTYPGLYPSWGESTSGPVKKVHLVAHSMGGQTTRMLVQLLAEGSQAERNASPTDVSPLFDGGKSWVASVSTIASPNDGTSLADRENPLVMKDLAKNLLLAMAVTAGCGDEPVYDFKLDQWGLKRKSGEGFFSYAERVWNSSVWTDSKDFSLWDLSTDGAMAMNQWVKARPDVYYFSYAVSATQRGVVTGHQVPSVPAMNPLFYGTSLFMGSFTRHESGRVVVDSSWWPNDGIVNTTSHRGPTWGSLDEIVDYGGTARIGKWNYMGLRTGVDHGDSIGINLDVEDWYRALAARLGSLPVIN